MVPGDKRAFGLESALVSGSSEHLFTKVSPNSGTEKVSKPETSPRLGFRLQGSAGLWERRILRAGAFAPDRPCPARSSTLRRPGEVRAGMGGQGNAPSGPQDVWRWGLAWCPEVWPPSKPQSKALGAWRGPPGRAQGSAARRRGGREALQGPRLLSFEKQQQQQQPLPPRAPARVLASGDPRSKQLSPRTVNTAQFASTFSVHKSSWRARKFEYLISPFE